MTEEMLEESNKPFVTIDDVQVYIDDLPEEGKQIFGRLQRLNQKKANAQLDVEEYQAGINFFSNRLITLYNEDEELPTEPSETE
jgi:hypothetical protein|tara:strand:- start:8473 stop:8724 length:252 start_codon:yes stop_codon:yes gene_type:complete